MRRFIAGILLLGVTSFTAIPLVTASSSIPSPTEVLAASSTTSGIEIGSLIFNAFNAVPTQQESLTSTTISSALAPEATVCGDIINAHNANGKIVFPAKQVYDCLTSVPFNPAVASRFLQYYNDTIQFQSTLAYLKSPPSSYQQPSVDVMESLHQIQQDIDNGVFHNQYAFEATLQKVIQSTHDDHLRLDAGILAAFSFSSPYGITSVSSDGIQLPKVYLTAHLDTDKTHASPVSKINDQDVISFLSQFAAINAIGGLEPHTDWNSLMSSHALGIQGRFNYFGGFATFYPGDAVTFTLENGTKITKEWKAYYNSPGSTGPLATGGDFYNFFVLGQSPASYKPSNSGNSNSKRRGSIPKSPGTATKRPLSKRSFCDGLPTNTGWADSAYPVADVAQPDLKVNGGGFITGYFLKDVSIGVLSIPSFDEYGSASNTFSRTIKCFIEASRNANLKQIVIDVQQNRGGNPLLAVDAFRQFFPSDEPWATSRMRAHSTADIIGNTITNYWDTLTTNGYAYDLLSTSEWLASDRINAETNDNFTSWQAFYGPHQEHQDHVTTNQRYDFSSYIFDRESLASSKQSTTADDLQKPPSSVPPPYAANDIVILSDGLCSSSCALFLEMMHHQARVKTVVVGGRPSYGPMQAPAGTRGARSYSAGFLDEDFTRTVNLNETTHGLLPTRKHDIWVRHAGLNLRDQIRMQQNAIPLQFVYEAADCRIFYTKETYNNYNRLWRYAAEAIWSNPSKCVQGSAGYASYGSDTDSAGPPQPPQNNSVLHGMPGVAKLGGPYNILPVSSSHVLSDEGFSRTCHQGQPCKRVVANDPFSHDCPDTYDCVPADHCDTSGNIVKQMQCWPSCATGSFMCLYGICRFDRKYDYRSLHPGHQKEQDSQGNIVWVGTCPSRPVDPICQPHTQQDEALFLGSAPTCN